MAEISPAVLMQRMEKAPPQERLKIRRQLLELMNPNLRKWFDSVEDKVTDRVQANLMFYWNLGKEAEAIHKDEAKYGANAISLCAACFAEDKSVLYKSMTFHEDFNEEELEHLLSLRMKETNRPVLWSHIVVLLGPKHKAKRVHFLNKLVANNWTHAELKNYVETVEGKTSEDRRGGGRKVKVPGTVDKMLHHMDRNLRPIEKKFQEVWNNDAHGLLKLVQSTPPDDFTPGMLANVNQMLGVMTTLREGVSSQMRQLQQAKTRIEKVLSKKASGGEAEEFDDAPKSKASKEAIETAAE
jgi:hypothetical protein